MNSQILPLFIVCSCSQSKHSVQEQSVFLGQLLQEPNHLLHELEWLVIKY